ncbi:DUF167 domain-containing protein [Nitrosovibrio sp. Nv17]|uniref:DUF167 domain-containing protein n=1 Tax=Nitrosovibrio sp. Nv17 TaxID=1855339 RepID=UPI000931A644|nr:DUF167 domain-containing protein [Nitrosovibrio sp. Nv17]
MPSWYRSDDAGQRYTLTLHVQPGARRTEVAGLHGDALKIRLAAPAVDGAANAALLAFLAEAFGVSRHRVTLRHGARSRRKTVEIRQAALPPEALISEGH